uniref:Uncharacterized protein n=1 Tax=Physcomitrium patens TaxID=3218 RepID=A0A2K1JUB1_PHYPA|nr:hypothetical protein PHYPA_014867 [Physcomitrium patens]
MFGISRNPCGLHLIRVKGAEMFLLQFCVCDVALVWLRAVGRIAGQECVDCPGLGFRFRVLTTPLVNLRGAKDMRLLRAHLRNCTSCRLWTGNYLYLLLFIIQSEIACEERNTISRYRVHMLWSSSHTGEASEI